MRRERGAFHPKVLGTFVALAVVVGLTWAQSSTFGSLANLELLLYRTSLYGLLSLGAAFVIVTGGIDLSIGSMVCLVGLGVPWLALDHGWPIWLAIVTALLVAMALGAMHGLLITRLDLQPFVVTLCGLLLYRGCARGMTGDVSVALGRDFEATRQLVSWRWEWFEGFAPRPPLLLLAIVAVAAILFFSRTVWGRWMIAVGRNREAARLSGVPVDRVTIAAYVICAFFAGLGGLLFVLDGNGGKAASLGNFYELYAIAGAVLGGCSLRGGEISIVGVVLGTALMRVLGSAMVQLEYPTQLEFAVVGGVILVWVVADALIGRALRR